MESTRVDRWVWAVRLFKTRSMATEACRAGHERINDVRAKPASTVRVGDRVSARVGDRDRIVEVARVIDMRVGAPIAAECLVDHSPPPPPRDEASPFGVRDPGTGRPSKRERRQLDWSRGLRSYRPD